MNLYNHKIRNKRLVGSIVFAVILLLFLVRGLLLQSGTIDKLYTLDADQLHTALAKYEVTIQSQSEAGTVQGGGTILDGRKASTKDENYTLTIVTAAHVVGDCDSVIVTLPDGTTAEGTVVYRETAAGSSDSESAASDTAGMDSDTEAGSVSDIAFIQCQYAEEVDVYYSRDILGRLSDGDPAYVLKDGELVSGSVTDTDASIDGIGADLLLSDIGSENGMSGSGLYGKSGNYLGMIVQGTENGIAACISATEIVSLLNQQVL